MTLDEQQDLLILKRLIPTNKNLLLEQDFKNLIFDITGDFHETITDNLRNKLYIKFQWFQKSHYGQQEKAYSLTDIGIKAYNDLKKKKHNDLIQKIAFWILFVAAIVSAIYAVLTYYQSDETKNQSQHKQELLQTQDTTNNQKKSIDKLQYFDTLISHKTS